jgi:hypothetical protein
VDPGRVGEGTRRAGTGAAAMVAAVVSAILIFDKWKIFSEEIVSINIINC